MLRSYGQKYRDVLFLQEAFAWRNAPRPKLLVGSGVQQKASFCCFRLCCHNSLSRSAQGVKQGELVQAFRFELCTDIGQLQNPQKLHGWTYGMEQMYKQGSLGWWKTWLMLQMSHFPSIYSSRIKWKNLLLLLWGSSPLYGCYEPNGTGSTTTQIWT